MRDIWVEQEWEDLCERLRRTARYRELPEVERQADEFSLQEPPQRYPHLLDRVREAARLAVSWQEEVQKSEGSDDKDIVTEAGEESFPASDPPAWTTAAI